MDSHRTMLRHITCLLTCNQGDSTTLPLCSSPQVLNILCCAPSWVTPSPSSPPCDSTSSMMSSQATPIQGSRPVTPPLTSAGSPRSPLSAGKCMFLSTQRLLRKRAAVSEPFLKGLSTAFAHEDQYFISILSADLESKVLANKTELKKGRSTRNHQHKPPCSQHTDYKH